MIDAYYARENERARRNAIALYNASAFMADTVVKRLLGKGAVLEFSKAFPGFDKEASLPMDDDALLQQALALNAMLGGEVIYG